jgi:hypothetical protein
LMGQNLGQFFGHGTAGAALGGAAGVLMAYEKDRAITRALGQARSGGLFTHVGSLSSSHPNLAALADSTPNLTMLGIMSGAFDSLPGGGAGIPTVGVVPAALAAGSTLVGNRLLARGMGAIHDLNARGIEANNARRREARAARKSATEKSAQVADGLGRAIARELVKEGNFGTALRGVAKTVNNFGPAGKGTLMMNAAPRRTLALNAVPTPKPPAMLTPAAMPSIPSPAAQAAKKPFALPGTGTSRLLAAEAADAVGAPAAPGLLTRMSPNARFNAAAKAEGLAPPPPPAPPAKAPTSAAGSPPMPPAPAPAPGAPASSSKPLLGWRSKALVGGALLGTGYAGYKALQTAKDYMMVPSGSSQNWGAGGPQPKAGVNEWGQPQ